MSKLILIDGGIFCHRAIFDYGSRLQMKLNGIDIFVAPVGYTYFSSIISALKKIGVSTEDTIILTLEGWKSWRKDISESYKAQRKDAREKQKLINWEEKYKEIERINQQINESTPFHIVRVNRAECDDVIAVACRFFTDKEIVIASGDSDLEQLCYYPNVKIFSLWSKYKGVKGAYKVVKNPLKIIHDKVEKGDVGDNILVDKDNDTPEDAQLRKDLISLLELPEFIEKPVTEVLKTIGPKDFNKAKLPFPKSLALKFNDIYDPTFTVSYEDTIVYQEGREIRKKNKAKKLREAKKVSLR